MISLKEWNSFTPKTRRDILETLGENTEVLSQEYHHNFDFDRIGKVLKQILNCCYKQPNNTIKVCATIIPTYASKTEVSESTIKYCEYCGKEIEDTNDTGSLCYRCYMKEYYPDEQDL